MKKLFASLFLLNFLTAQEIYYYQNNQKVYLFPISGSLYETFAGAKVQLSENIIVSFKDSDNAKQKIQEIEKTYNVSYTIDIGYSKPIYLFRCKGDNVLTTANLIHNEPFVKEAYPDMYLVR